MTSSRRFSFQGAVRHRPQLQLHIQGARRRREADRARAWGAYVLEGSVRKAANRVRITGQLVDTATGAHLWAERFDGGLGDVFDLQDQVTESVVGAIAPAVEKAEIERAKRKPTRKVPTPMPSIYAGWPLSISLATGKRTRRHCACSTARSSSTRILRPPTVVPPCATSLPRTVAGFQTQRTRLPK